MDREHSSMERQQLPEQPGMATELSQWDRFCGCPVEYAYWKRLREEDQGKDQRLVEFLRELQETIRASYRI